MKPFDEEAAKRGERVEAFIKGVWVPVHYIGKTSAGNNIVEQPNGETDLRCDGWLRMAEKRTVIK